MLSSKFGKTPTNSNQPNPITTSYILKDLNSGKYNSEVPNIQVDDDNQHEYIMKEKFGVRQPHGIKSVDIRKSTHASA
jgi:hypothetical protein